MPDWLRTVLVVALACWPIWLALAVTYVVARIEVHRDRAWEDAPTLPANLGESR